MYIAASASRISSSAPAVESGVQDRYADAASQRELLAGDHERLAQIVEDPLGDLDGRVGVCQVLQQHHELIAAEASGRVAQAHAGRQTLGDIDQRLVAGVVPERRR